MISCFRNFELLWGSGSGAMAFPKVSEIFLFVELEVLLAYDLMLSSLL